MNGKGRCNSLNEERLDGVTAQWLSYIGDEWKHAHWPPEAAWAPQELKESPHPWRAMPTSMEACLCECARRQQGGVGDFFSGDSRARFVCNLQGGQQPTRETGKEAAAHPHPWECVASLKGEGHAW
eukprot:scaffold127737_cov31-Tisochrysis_lutea.AAC.4